MFKAIVTGDIHYQGINPRSRLDNYAEAIAAKIYNVYDLAREHQAGAIIIPGDLFHSPGVMWGTATELALILQQAPCSILTIHGNHDIWAGNPESKHRTPFGFLARLGLIWDLGTEPFETSDREEGALDICITGHGFNAETDTPAGAEQFDPPPHAFPWDGVAIHVVHSMLMDRDPGFDMRHTLISEVKTSADVIISGHEHTGFGFCFRSSGEIDAPLFINPGALCRLSAHVAEMERTVQVALLEVKDGQASAELIPLKSARPGREVLSREHIESAQERESRIDEFLRLLASEGEAKFLEVREIVEDLAARENIPGEVKAEALRRIGAAREALGGGAAGGGER